MEAANVKPTNAKKISISMFVITLPLLYVSLLHVPPSTLFRDTTFWFLISNSIIAIVAADSGIFSSSPHDSTHVDDLYDEYANMLAAHRPQVTAENGSSSAQVIKHVDDANEKAISNESRHELNERSSSESRHDHNHNHNPVVVDEKESSSEATEDQDSSLSLKRRSATANNEIVTGGRSRSEMAVKNRDFIGNKSSIRRSATEKRNCRLMEETEYWRMSDEELNKRVEDFIRKFNREIRLQAVMT